MSSSSINALRKIIREELKSVLKEQLIDLKRELTESLSKNTEVGRSGNKNNIRENLNKTMFPLTLNEDVKPAIPKFDTRNPLGSLLNETAISMTTDDVHKFNNSNYAPTEKVGSVQDMLANATPSSNMDMVQIDTVPDFTGMMDSLKRKGLL
jgi:hypothetical protein